MKVSVFYILIFSLVLSSCGIFGGGKTTNSMQEKLIGTWDLMYMKQGEKTITADKFGGDAYMKFLKDGQAIMKLPGQKQVTSRYYIEGNKILDLGSKDAGKMSIKTLEGTDLVLTMDLAGKAVDLRFKKDN